jgi:hypothetical protein
MGSSSKPSTISDPMDTIAGAIGVIESDSDDDTVGATAPLDDIWERPLPLQKPLPPVGVFDPELLPDSLRALAVDIAERMQAPLECPAVALVTAWAGAVNRRARIQPRALDTSWQVVPNLWGGIIAPPGTMKTPILKAAIAPLEAIEKQHDKDYNEALTHHEETE